MSSTEDLKKTAFHSTHLENGARMVDFGGWEMPVQYSGILKEHQAVRENAGVFDISHMGQLMVTGGDAAPFLNRMLTNDVTRLAPRTGHYTFLLNPDGGVIDDLFAYKLAESEFMLVVNASKFEEDLRWLREHLTGQVSIKNRSEFCSALALQGPKSAQILSATGWLDVPMPERNGITHLAGMDMFVSATGYTGENGFEILFPDTSAKEIWNGLMSAGHAFGCIPCGLGARDTLRLEACYPLNGADLSPGHTPLEAGMGWAVKLDKGDFLGREPLVKQKEDGLTRKLCAFALEGKSPPPRPHYPVFADDKKVSEATSATLSPSLGYGIGMAYMPVEHSKPGTRIELEIRGKRFPASIRKKPLYKGSS